MRLMFEKWTFWTQATALELIQLDLMLRNEEDLFQQ
jgi:hypothetical protein